MTFPIDFPKTELQNVPAGKQTWHWQINHSNPGYAVDRRSYAGDGLIRQENWPEAFEVVGLSQPPGEILEDREEDGSPWVA